MIILAIAIFFQITLAISKASNKLKKNLFHPRQQISFISLSDTDSNISMSEGTLNLEQGEQKYVVFNNPYGLVLMRNWKNVLLNVITYDQSGKQINMQPMEEGGPKIGIYFGEYTGTVQMLALQPTSISYATIDFPKDCTYRYVSNTVTRSFTLKASNFLNDSTFCYFNTAQLPITYAVNYSLGDDYLRILTNSDADVNATNKGHFDRTLSVPAFIKIVTGKNIRKNHFVNIKMSSSGDEKPSYKYSDFLKSTTPIYIVGEKKHPKVSKSTISALVVACIVFLALVMFALTYLCASRRRRHRRHHHRHHNGGSSSNTNQNNNNNNSNSTTNNNNNNNNQNGDENPEEKDVIVNGRYKTPAHVNIELISSQFDQKYKSSNQNFFLRKSSSRFDNDQGLNDYDVENNGYPLNEYHAPSKGILAPTSISQFSDNDVDDEYDEDKDLEGIKEASFKTHQSDSDTD